ncbi:QRFP-like peptide receptor [Porites lutea]|uniref:QRFP-like peptide receptor n=1 Tax=Porites lutea TaxID=51062 RepID=UPI003CC52E06
MSSTYQDFGVSETVVKTAQGILIILNIMGNFLVCVIIVKEKDMRTPVNFLLMNLAIADMAVAVFFAPRYLFIHSITHPEGTAGLLLCKLLTSGNLAWVGAASSVVTLVSTAFERYYAVLHPHGTKGNLTENKVKVIIPCSWIFGVVINIVGILCDNVNEEKACAHICPEEWMNRLYSSTWFLFVAFFPVCLMATLYARVVYALWFKSENSTENSVRQQGVMKIRKRVTLMVLIVSVVFAVCWLTDASNFILSDFSVVRTSLPIALTNTLILFNSAINPIVYALVNLRFRRKFKSMICCFRRRTRNIVNPTFPLTNPTQTALSRD